MDSHNPDERSSKMICFDRLSNLPDELLEKILSFLPTKNAIGASILSKRWNNLNPFGVLPIRLDLDDSQFIQPDGAEYRHLRSFDKFVYKLFNETLRDVPCIESMSLKCDYEYESQCTAYESWIPAYHSWVSVYTSWLSAAINLKVNTLVLSLRRLETEALFEQLDGNTSLVCLELSSHDRLLIRRFGISLPSLKRLRLNKAYSKACWNVMSIDGLVDCCPMLEELEIVGCSFHHESSQDIQSPKLKSLTIEDTCLDKENDTVLKIPNLELFMFKSCVPQRDFDFTFKSLTSANLIFRGHDDDNDDDYNDVSKNIGKIIAACSSTKGLYISFKSITDLHFTSLQLPVFQNLIRLSLGYLRNDGWTVFACLLKSAPMLEHLTFEEGLPRTGFESFERLLKSPPTCLELHIKSIEFRRFRWEEIEVNVLNYFKKRGKVLERLVVNLVVEPIGK